MLYGRQVAVQRRGIRTGFAEDVQLRKRSDVRRIWKIEVGVTGDLCGEVTWVVCGIVPTVAQILLQLLPEHHSFDMSSLRSFVCLSLRSAS